MAKRVLAKFKSGSDGTFSGYMIGELSRDSTTEYIIDAETGELLWAAGDPPIGREMPMPTAAEIAKLFRQSVRI